MTSKKPNLSFPEIHIPGPKDYWVDVWDDDRNHSITVAKFDSFSAALGEYNRLIKDPPQMRVVMRHRAHVFRNYIPLRMANSYDRSREYPTDGCSEIKS